MPDLNTNEPAEPQGLAETMAVVRAAKTAMADARKAEQEHRRQTRKRLKGEAAGLTEQVRRDRKTEKAKLRKRASRASLAASVAADLADMPPAVIDRKSFDYERIAFEKWLSQPGRGAVRRIESERPGEIMKSRELHLLLREEGGGREPTHALFAARLPDFTGRSWSVDQGRRRLEMLLRFEERGGPFGM